MGGYSPEPRAEVFRVRLNFNIEIGPLCSFDMPYNELRVDLARLKREASGKRALRGVSG